MHNKKVVVDTNILMNEKFDISKYEKVYIPIIVIEELDNHKISGDNERAYKARRTLRNINSANNVEYAVDYTYSMPRHLLNTKLDNSILGFAKEIIVKNPDVVFLTNDLNLKLKADSIKVPCEQFNENINSLMEEYQGYSFVDMSENELANWYQNEVKANVWNLNINEYLFIRNKLDKKVVDSWVWTTKGFRHISTKKIDSVSLGKIKLLDEYQVCAVDSLSNNAVTMIKGKAGSGKSLLTASYGMSMVEKGKIDKIIVFTNPVATKNSARLGFYPGTKDEKLLDSQIGNMLTSKFGDKMEIEQLIHNRKLVLMPFSDIRGFDTTGMKSLIWITEAQNLDIELMRLAIQRVGDDCQIVIDGDYNAQVDCREFDGFNNGMKRVSEIFRGKDFYGEVELQKIYRSKWSELAELL